MAAILVCSRAGENLIEGQLKKLGLGNTQILAEKLSEQLQCPLYPLAPVEPYHESYQAMVEQAQKLLMIFPVIKQYRLRFLKNGYYLLDFPTGGGAIRGSWRVF